MFYQSEGRATCSVQRATCSLTTIDHCWRRSSCWSRRQWLRSEWIFGCF